jgi:ubiquitin-like modifier-activating enzyme ATG7
MLNHCHTVLTKLDIRRMAPLQFQPLASQPTPSFWSALNTLKLDKLKLDDTQQPISGWLEEGREVVDKENGDRRVGVDGSLGVGGSSFGEGTERYAKGRGIVLKPVDPQVGVYLSTGSSRTSIRLKSSELQSPRKSCSTPSRSL